MSVNQTGDSDHIFIIFIIFLIGWIVIKLKFDYRAAKAPNFNLLKWWVFIFHLPVRSQIISLFHMLGQQTMG